MNAQPTAVLGSVGKRAAAVLAFASTSFLVGVPSAHADAFCDRFKAISESDAVDVSEAPLKSVRSSGTKMVKEVKALQKSLPANAPAVIKEFLNVSAKTAQRMSVAKTRAAAEASGEPMFAFFFSDKAEQANKWFEDRCGVGIAG